jgi:hypothetical protein
VETVVVAIQILCAAGLALGIVLSIYQLLKGRDERFSFAVANDFETGFRRIARRRPARGRSARSR